jgi:DNA repair protein RadA/Sms
LAMVLAVLEARAGVSLAQHDVYLNIAGGLRLKETACDLAVAAALLSSMSDTVIPHGTAVFGEIALSGSVRPVGQTEARLKECQKLGLEDAVIADAESPNISGLQVKKLANVADLVAWVASRAKGIRRVA